MAIPLRALIVEDSQDDCDLLLSMLCKGGYDVMHKRVYSPTVLTSVLDEGPWDIVISDYSMPGFKGTDALAMVRKRDLDLPFVFLSGTIGEEIRRQCDERGSPRLRHIRQRRATPSSHPERIARSGSPPGTQADGATPAATRKV